jgi:hypothetical protein
MFKNKKYLILIVVLLIIIGLVIYNNMIYEPLKGNEKYLNKDNIIKKDKYIYFESQIESDTALIFYPGGLVEEKAYAPLCLMFSEAGFSIFLVKMPFNLAVFNKNRAENILKDYNNKYKNLYLIGHSLGGAMAASYLAENINKYKGIIFLASYPPKKVDLSNSKIKVLSILATNDGIINEEKLKESKDNLPSYTEFNIIKGGNHAGFGNYGPQDGDGDSSINKKEQWKLTVDYTIDFIEKVEEVY